MHDFFLNLANFVHAQGAGAVTPLDPTSITVNGLILRIINWALYISGAVAVLYVMYGGILYITSGGDEEKATQGRTAITNAVIGIIIIALSLVAVTWINDIIGGTAPVAPATTTNNNTTIQSAVTTFPGWNNPNDVWPTQPPAGWPTASNVIWPTSATLWPTTQPQNWGTAAWPASPPKNWPADETWPATNPWQTPNNNTNPFTVK